MRGVSGEIATFVDVSAECEGLIGLPWKLYAWLREKAFILS